jgi:hypothetical protein
MELVVGVEVGVGVVGVGVVGVGCILRCVSW